MRGPVRARLEKFDSVRESDLETSQRGPEVPAWVPGGKPEGAQNAFPCLRGNGRVLVARLLSRKVGRQRHDSLSGRGLGPGLRRPGPESEPSEGAMRVRRRVTLTRSDPWGAGYPHSSRADAAGQWPMWAPRSKEIPLAPLEKSTVGRADRRRSDGGLRFSWPRRGLRLGETAPRSSRSSPRWKIAGPLLEAPGPVCKTRSNL